MSTITCQSVENGRKVYISNLNKVYIYIRLYIQFSAVLSDLKAQ